MPITPPDPAHDDYTEKMRQRHGWICDIWRGEQANQKLWVPARYPLTLDGLYGLLDPGFIPFEQRGRPKDGPCFLPGTLLPFRTDRPYSPRKADRVTRIDLLVFDLDIGALCASVRGRLWAAGCRNFMIVPTYSHMSRDYSFKVPSWQWPAYLATFNGQYEEIALAHAGQHFMPEIVAAGLDGPVEVTQKSDKAPVMLHYRLELGVPRWRVILPLASPWIAPPGGGQDIETVWNQQYHAAARALGLWDFDPSCSGAEHFYYSARWPAAWPRDHIDARWSDLRDAGERSGEPVPDWIEPSMDVPPHSRSICIERGRMTDLHELLQQGDLPLAQFDAERRAFVEQADRALNTLPRAVTGKRGKGREPSWLVVRPDTGETVDFSALYHEHGFDLPLADWVEERTPELLATRGWNGDRLHIECPASDLHSTTATGGTFVRNGHGSRGGLNAARGGLICMHNGCAQREHGESLELLMLSGVFDWSDIDRIKAEHVERLAAATAAELDMIAEAMSDIAEDGEQSVAADTGAGGGDGGGGGGGPPPAFDLGGFPPTEYGMAAAFAAKYAGQVLYRHPHGWMRWVGHIWHSDHKQVVLGAIGWLAQTKMAQLTKPPPGLSRAVFYSGTEKILRAMPRVATGPEEWDTNSWLLGTPGGTVDLRTGELRPGQRGDKISRSTLVTPAPRGTPTPIFDTFLTEVTLDNPDYVRFLLQVFGYALFDGNPEEIMFVLVGKGGAGVGTLLGLAGDIWGDYARAADIATFLETRGERHPQELARLAGARLVTTTEPDENRKWGWGRVRALTGRDTQAAHHMRENDIEFKPGFLPMVGCNRPPPLPGTDRATARRMIIAPFDFMPKVADINLKDRLKAEYPGILRRFIDGCLDWQANKLLRPAVVVVATQRYLQRHLQMQRWLAMWVEFESGAVTTVQAAYAAWCQFCETVGHGHEPGPLNKFTEALLAAAQGKIVSAPGHNTGRGYRGMKLLEKPRDSPDDFG